jgi:transglutaminase-like putative cysteine protease
MEVEAVLRSRTLVQLKASETPPTVAPLTPAEEKAYRAATKHIDHDSRAFGEWLDAKKLRRISTESPLEFAARILSVIRADYRYKFDPDEDKRASVTCKGKAADCGGMGYLFVGALRASDIPARLIVGRLALPRKIDSTPTEIGYDRPHIRAEVYLTGVGWVPVDPAYANTNKQKPVTAFIGADPGDLLVLHVDADFQLPFPDKIRESQLLQIGPYYWTTGRGTFDGYFGPTRWDVKTTRIENK